MFNSIAFDVVIGLVFIYLLYSLLVSIVGEMLSTWMAIRSRILRIAVERMLNDGYFDENGNKKHTGLIALVAKFFLKEFTKDFSKSFAGKFYDQPAIKYLSKGNKEDSPSPFTQTKPSYFTDEYFADALLQLLKDKGAGDTDGAKIRFCLTFNTHHIQPETLKYLRNLLDDAKGDMPLFKEKIKTWYNEMMDRITGWYKRKMQFILFWLGFIIAAAFNVDSIAIAKILANDKDARAQLVEMGVNFAKDTSQKNTQFIHNDNDSLYTKSVIDTSYNKVMKDINAANLILGLGWNFDKMTKSETVKIYKYDYSRVENNLKHTLEANDSLENLRRSYTNTALISKQKTDVLNIMKEDSVIAQLQTDSGKLNSDSIGRNILTVEKQIGVLGSTLKIDSLRLLSQEKVRKQNVQIINNSLKTNFIDIDTFLYDINQPPNFYYLYGKTQFTLADKISYINSKFNPLNSSFWGWVITALMLSLGAPFWFDLLKKLVSLRGAGVNPDEKKEAKEETRTIFQDSAPEKSIENISSIVLASVEAALKVYGEEIRNEKGVLKIYKGYFFTGNKTNECLQVNVIDNSAKSFIENKYKDVTLFKHVVLKVDFTGLPKTHGGAGKTIIGNPEKGIANTTELLGWGSFGCIMIDNSNENLKYAVSCYHVMNGDFAWKNDGQNRNITNQTAQISNSYEGCLNAKLDTAYTSQISQDIYNFYSKWKPKGKLEVTPNHLRKKVHFKGYITKLNEGIIVNDSCPAEFDYPIADNTFISQSFEDLIAISSFDSNNIQRPISQAGDSGSLVLDEKDVAIGIIVGSDLIQTYLIKITTIENEMNISLDC